MKKYCFLILALVMTSIVWAFTLQSENPITKTKDGTIVVNTSSIAADVKGFKGATPLKIYLKKGKIKKVEALANQETHKFFKAVEKELLNKWNGLSVKQARQLKVDAVSGATFSSKAVINSLQKGLEYYQKNKK